MNSIRIVCVNVVYLLVCLVLAVDVNMVTISKIPVSLLTEIPADHIKQMRPEKFSVS